MALAARIKFGTDGWRGVIADDFTYANVARVGAAIAASLHDPRRSGLAPYREWGVPCRPAAAGLIVGYDTRFLSAEFARHLGRAVAEAGIPVQVTDGPVPTPAVSAAVVKRGLAGGAMITASHNPPQWSGVKFKPEYGGSATAEITALIESHLPPHAPEIGDPPVEAVAIKEEYLARLRDAVDLRELARAPLYVVVDAMYGSAQGYLASLLRAVRIPHLAVRSTVDPLFGGKKPEPLPENVVPLKAVIRSLRARARGRIVVGLITDGDGDRAAAMDERGQFLDTHRTAALLVWHLSQHRNLDGMILKSFALTDMIGKLADHVGVPWREIQVGFKWAVEDLVTGKAAFAGEESGGYGYAWHLPERDGVLSNLLLLELVAATGKPLGALVEELFELVGPHHYARRDLALPTRLEVMERLAAAPPERLAGQRVVKVETLDGLKLRLDRGWVLFRASGTEPILRLYCEMDSPAAVQLVLGEAERLARGGLL
ncbi:MAG: phosphoglucomutase/phosphomannomutase family protein [Candidatus Bipolaricaulis anaerobius]|jgi:phosphomannomutase|uniref:Phosphoglucomutase n=1 Tax=Candidatus Bipolaricaulis anaerobius TaxID=2026885 RepID=A0A2X3KZ37_9BACT|nr:phosphoglucomutase/phosphomannomutase family protein [Candidatus Bipolaricaulis anaerobius]MDD5763889.1 phosphoglucomutase/phosphomannomutase family protein [Candidatus Bipolaricaulis anaerobius]SQD92776.1 Phosphoglucomutase [Candidatus Bipolaricaulis anaerobius]HOD73123.1 phosphoglucomutase/phosphomannomutase family protein [Candidatus Bipolaricaulis anaerobius]HQM38584.1 phosphoglucomutase/phosphomannomutase family protein [Candidatus Bipolaricaulis anaerobius]